MSEAVSRAAVEAFYAAYISRDPRRIGACLDDDVEWYVGGPVDAIQICGSWHGKAAVIDRFTHLVPRIIDFKKLDIDALLVDGDSSAAFGRITSIHRASGRLISHRVSQLARYRAGKVISFRVINDTLDAAEQFTGHRIGLTTSSTGGWQSDLIAV